MVHHSDIPAAQSSPSRVEHGTAWVNANSTIIRICRIDVCAIALVTLLRRLRSGVQLTSRAASLLARSDLSLVDWGRSGYCGDR
jgi:hypothetical protein